MNTVNIEKIACNAVGKYLTDCRSLVPYIEENDKTPIWDGNVFIYHSEDICNNNLIGRYPLQVKGTEVNSFSDSTFFSVRVSDLRKFYQEGGCVFFVVQEMWNAAQEEFLTQIFYNILDRSKISSLLEDCETVDSKTIFLHRVPLSKKLFVEEINTALINKNQVNNSIRVAELDALLNYVYQLNEYFEQIEDSEKRRSIQALVKSLSALKCTSDSNWVDQVFAYMRALIFEVKTCIYEYGVSELYFALAQFCESVNYLYSAEKYYEEALAICRKYVANDEETYLPNVANTLSNLGNLHVTACDLERADIELEEAHIIFHRLSQSSPDRYLPFVALVLNNKGNLHFALHDYELAETDLLASLSITDEYETAYLICDSINRACSLITLGAVYFESNRFEEAIGALNKAVAIFGKQNEDGRYNVKLALAFNNLGNAYCRMNEYIKAEEAYLESLSIYKALSLSLPQANDVNVAMVLNNLGGLYHLTGYFAKEKESLYRAISILRRLRNGGDGFFSIQYVEALRNWAICNYDKDITTSTTAITEAVDLCRTLYERYPQAYAELFKRVLQVAISCHMATKENDTVAALIDEGNNVIRTMHELENSN